jgi:type II secretory ATPase GspE/PulE/Tfp pilus assembly ATPase PilB-like protein
VNVSPTQIDKPSTLAAAASAGGEGKARLGERLLTQRLITEDQLQVALHEQRSTGAMLGAVLVDLGFITESMLAEFLAERSGFDRVDLKSMVLDPALVRRLPKDVARRLKALPVAVGETTIQVAMADPYDVMAIDQLRRYFPRELDLTPLISGETDILEAIDQYYGYEMSIDGILKELETGVFDVSSLVAEQGQYVHPVVRLVNMIMFDAVKTGASDLHFEPEAFAVRLRYRTDGVMHKVRILHKDHWPAIGHRIKIMAGMNIADSRSIQDGRFSIRIGSRSIDFRVSLLPTVHGENIVIRVLDHTKSLLPLEILGYSEDNLALLRRMLRRPEGIIIVTGPTGSGKTTTLYSMLREVSTSEVNVMTLEDPVEYQMALVRQTQVKESAGITFVDGVRAILRQDPDIVFIGEMRDSETAQMALRAGMTGHQVFSTLHTNDAIGAVPRLMDLGLSTNMLAGNIICTIAQRLVRKLCPVCKEMLFPATEAECRVLGVDPANAPIIARPVGCDDCRYTGYKGRVAVCEVLRFTPEFDDAMAQGATRAQLKALAREQGFITMAEDGIRKVLRGEINIASLVRAVDMTDRL